MTKKEEKEEKDACACPAELSSYLCRLCTLCVHLSILGGGINPTTVLKEKVRRLVRRFRPEPRNREAAEEAPVIYSFCPPEISVSGHSGTLL
jgi:hypothetical protein